ncbi:unnamed protein product [Cylicocyclus nassatus]|uniref:Transthyretin-like family protein n=1 Tax=Cylicocyclus nassatus TaxID=53992 RepID=A0AA36HER5_CYLNA|nr:unnamed protein product [Cylicocyclus nassatus]
MLNFYCLLWILLYITYVYGVELAVRGKFVCVRRRNIIPIDVKLMEEDFSGVWLLNMIDSDDILAHDSASYGETFLLTGREHEFGGIEPYIEAIHYCRGYREVIQIPLNVTKDDSSQHIGNYVLDRRRHTVTAHPRRRHRNVMKHKG